MHLLTRIIIERHYFSFLLFSIQFQVRLTEKFIYTFTWNGRASWMECMNNFAWGPMKKDYIHLRYGSYVAPLFLPVIIVALCLWWVCVCVNVLYTLVFFHINWKLYAWVEMCIQNWILALRILYLKWARVHFALVFSQTTTFVFICVICFSSTSYIQMYHKCD